MFLELIANQLLSAKKKREKNPFERQRSLPPPLGYTASVIFVPFVLKHPCVISILYTMPFFISHTHMRMTIAEGIGQTRRSLLSQNLH